MHLLDLNLVPLCARLCVFRLLAGLLGAEGFESIGGVLAAKLGAGAQAAALTRRSIEVLVEVINSTVATVSKRSVGDALPAAYVLGGGELVERLQKQWAAAGDGDAGAAGGAVPAAVEKLTWPSLPSVVNLQASQCRTLLMSFGVALARLDGNCDFALGADTAEFNWAVEKSNRLFDRLFALYRSAYSTESSAPLVERVSDLTTSIRRFLAALRDLDAAGAAFSRFATTINFEILLGLPKALSLWGNLLACSTVIEENANGRAKKEARSSSRALARNGIGIFMEMKKNFDLEMEASGTLNGLLVEASPDLARTHVRHWVPAELIPGNDRALAAAPSVLESSARPLSVVGALPTRGVIAPHFPPDHTIKCFLKFLPVNHADISDIRLYTRFMFGGRRTRTRWDSKPFHARNREGSGKQYDYHEDDPSGPSFRQRPFGLASRASALPGGASCVVELLGALRLPTLPEHLIYMWAVYFDIVGDGAAQVPEPSWSESNDALVVHPQGTSHGALKSTSLAMTAHAPPGVLPRVQVPFDALLPVVALPLPRARRAAPRVLVKQLSYNLDPVEHISLIDREDERRAIFGDILENETSAAVFGSLDF